MQIRLLSFSRVLNFFALLLIVSCSSTPPSASVEGNLLEEAQAEIDNGRYLLAVDKLRELKTRYPSSSEAILADLKIADVFYKQGNYIEAAANYDLFRELHPAHPQASYAYFQSGLSHFNDIPGTVQRDLTPAENALTLFKNFTTLYPSDPRKGEAIEKIKELKNLLAEKESTIAEYYYHRKKWEAAQLRYEGLLEKYPESKLAELAKERLLKIEELKQ